MELKRKYKTLNRIEVSKQALLSNYQYFKQQNPQAQIALVLKSNAYGHGLNLIGRFVDREIKPPFIIVDSLYEAYELDKSKVTTPILIIGYTFPQNFKIAKRLNFIFPVYDQETALVLTKHQPQVKVHLKIDSGMNRLGLKPKDVPEFITFLRQECPKLKVDGIYSHLAQADEPEGLESVNKQVQVFKEVIRQFEQAGFQFSWKHISATAGSILVRDSEFNLVRLGLGFYIKNPALRLITHLVQTKQLQPGDRVSYGGTFTAVKPMTIGILPLGYYDGLDRRLSNKGSVMIDGKVCPIVGRVCMNLTMVDISDVINPKVGQEVIVYSDNVDDLNSIVNSAKLAQTIPYVLLVKLSQTTRRVLVQ